MAGTTLGTAYVQIVPSADGISGSITNVLGGEATKAGTKAGGLFSGGFGTKVAKGAAIAGAALATGVAVGTAALKKGIQETAAYGDNVDKMSQKLGLSAESYQKWDYVLNLAGTDMQSMTTGLKTLTNQFEAAKNGNAASVAAFEQLGISMEEAANMSREDLFGAAIKGLQGMEDSTERAALANKLFGKSGQNLTPLFNQTAEQTQEQIALAEKYGMVMPEAAVKASAAFQDSMTTMQMTMTGMKNRMMAEFLPSVTQITDGLAKMFAGDMSGADDVAAGIQGVISKIGEMTPQVLAAAKRIGGQLLKGIAEKAPQMAEKAGVLVGKLVAGFIKNLPKILATGAKLIVKFAAGLVKSIPQVVSAVAKIGAKLIHGLGSALYAKVTAAAKNIKEKFMKPIEDIKTKVKAVLDKVKGFFPLSVGKIFSNIKLPHFNISGGTAPWGIGGLGTKPTISISWYAKGGIVDGATLIGAGERGAEAIVPLDPFWKRLDKAVSSGGDNITINVYASDGMDINALAIAVEQRLVQVQKRRQLAWQ